MFAGRLHPSRKTRRSLARAGAVPVVRGARGASAPMRRRKTVCDRGAPPSLAPSPAACGPRPAASLETIAVTCECSFSHGSPSPRAHACSPRPRVVRRPTSAASSARYLGGFTRGSRPARRIVPPDPSSRAAASSISTTTTSSARSAAPRWPRSEAWDAPRRSAPEASPGSRRALPRSCAPSRGVTPPGAPTARPRETARRRRSTCSQTRGRRTRTAASWPTRPAG
jgi:hypothetical protein